MNIKPLGKRLLLQVVEVEEKTKGGLILPGNATKESKNIAEVVGIGTGEGLEEIKIGDKVVFEKYGNTEIKDEHKIYLIVELDKVLAIID